MVRPDFREIKMRNNGATELYHYGMPERSGRYAWGSGDRPYQRLEGKVSKMEDRLKKKFAKADSKTSKLQSNANRRFNKANAQRNSVFRSARNRADRNFDRGYTLEEKKQRIEYRMSKTYERYMKQFTNLNVTMDSDLQAKGLDYYNRVLANTDSQYKAALLRRVS